MTKRLRRVAQMVSTIVMVVAVSAFDAPQAALLACDSQGGTECSIGGCTGTPSGCSVGGCYFPGSYACCSCMAWGAQCWCAWES